MEKTINIRANKEFITLSQLLKFEAVVQSGGEVREYLAEHPVLVNDAVEVRRGRKLYKGDVVVIDDITFKIEGV